MTERQVSKVKTNQTPLEVVEVGIWQTMGGAAGGVCVLMVTTCSLAFGSSSDQVY